MRAGFLTRFFFGGWAASEGPIFAARLLPPLFGLSTASTMLRISGVKGRVPEDGSFRYSSRILLVAGTLRNIALGMEATNENLELLTTMIFVVQKIAIESIKESSIIVIFVLLDRPLNNDCPESSIGDFTVSSCGMGALDQLCSKNCTKINVNSSVDTV